MNSLSHQGNIVHRWVTTTASDALAMVSLYYPVLKCILKMYFTCNFRLSAYVRVALPFTSLYLILNRFCIHFSACLLSSMTCWKTHWVIYTVLLGDHRIDSSLTPTGQNKTYFQSDTFSSRVLGTQGVSNIRPRRQIHPGKDWNQAHWKALENVKIFELYFTVYMFYSFLYWYGPPPLPFTLH